MKTSWYGRENSWKITGLSDDKVVLSDAILNDDTLYTYNKCLEPGCYKFTVYDEDANGICCGWMGDGFYDLHINNALIFEKGEGRWSKQEHFFCDSATSFSPSSSALPTYTPSSSTTLMPSISSHPTLNIIASNDIFSISQNIPRPNDAWFNMSTVLGISNSFIVTGNPEADSWKGELYIYNINGLYLHTIRPYDGNGDDWFAWSLSIHNELIVVGSPAIYEWNRFNDKKGKAYVYHVSGDLFAKLTPPDSMKNNLFGWSVGISESHICIGAPQNGRGKAYIYTTTLNPVGIPVEIVPNDLDYRGWFASSLSLSGDRIVFGAQRQDNWRGVAYIYNTIGEQIAKLKASDGQSLDWFGADVAIDGDTVAVGAPLHDYRRGIMYIFDRTGKEINKVTDPDGEEFDKFGFHVYASKKFIAVRARDSVFMCDKAGKILAKLHALGGAMNGDVALTNDELVVYDDRNKIVILMEHGIFPLAAPSLSSSPSISPYPTVVYSQVSFKVTVEIQTDDRGDETSWEITQSGSVVFIGEGYGNNQLYFIQECLPYGCYEFVIKDSAWDGIISPGYFKLFVEDELVFEGGSGEWELLLKSFCFGV